MTNQPENDDVAPGWLIGLLGLAWILLVGGRWIATPFIMFSSPVVSERFIDLDRGPLLKCYLVLLCITLLLPTMRAVRKYESARTQSAAKAIDSVDAM